MTRSIEYISNFIYIVILNSIKIASYYFIKKKKKKKKKKMQMY
jgi:hypothetical protein